MNRRERRTAAKMGSRSAGTDMIASGLRDNRAALLRDHAVRCYQSGQFREASLACQQLIALDPGDIAGLHITGLVALQAGRSDVAIDILGTAIGINGKLPDLHVAIAEAQQRLGRLEEALAHYRQALALDPSHVEALYNCGNALLKLRRYQEALAQFDKVLVVEPTLVVAINNRGAALFELRRYEAALTSFDRALAINPEFADAWANRGTVLVELKKYEEGIADCERALALDPTNATALANRGNGLFELRRYAEAAAGFERLLTVAPDHPYAAGKAFYFRLLCCDWTDYDHSIAAIADKVEAGARAVIPFMFLNMSDSVSARMRCAQTFSKDKYPASADPVWRGERYDHGRIRVAYLSADFRHHPMAYSMRGLFEAHDRSRFETIAVSFGPDPKDEFRKRLENSFDRFVDVQAASDRDVALLLREMEIDIAIDLMGYTNNCRPGILANRPVPIQTNYIGFAGTLGADYVDYIIADRFIVPRDCCEFYSEQVVYLPDTYWPTDCGLVIGAHTPTREEAGLPQTGFVFCCFNQNSKIAPPTFDIWMRLLLQIEGSVLWLVEDNSTTAGNLRREAERRRVAPNRLVFAPRVPIEEYLARFRLADLFLDTLPFNAHTTAADALWAGVPLLTCAGSSFAARVAGSLLNAVGLPELITDDLPEYEALALRLARDDALLAKIKAKLARNRGSFSLFDTVRFTRHIESAYYTMWERHQRGEPPTGFSVPRITGTVC